MDPAGAPFITAVVAVLLALPLPALLFQLASAPYHCLAYTQTDMAPNRSLQKWF